MIIVIQARLILSPLLFNAAAAFCHDYARWSHAVSSMATMRRSLPPDVNIYVAALVLPALVTTGFITPVDMRLHTYRIYDLDFEQPSSASDASGHSRR